MAKTTKKKAESKARTGKSRPGMQKTKSQLLDHIEGLTSELELARLEKEKSGKQHLDRLAEVVEDNQAILKQSEQDKEILRDEIESTRISTAGLALIVVCISVCSLILIASSQSRWPVLIVLAASGLILTGSTISSFIGNRKGFSKEDGFFWSVICGLILGILGGTCAKGAYLHNSWIVYLLYIGLGVALFFAITYASYKKRESKFSCPTTILLSLIFLVTSCAGIYPISRHYHLKKIERDKNIVEMLEITSEPNGIEILLPAEYASRHKYMRQVLCLKWPDQELVDAQKIQTWNDLSIKCSEGEKKWYKARLDFPVRASAIKVGEITLHDREYFPKKEVILFFNHAWKDYEATKNIPLPDPNSL